MDRISCRLPIEIRVILDGRQVKEVGGGVLGRSRIMPEISIRASTAGVSRTLEITHVDIHQCLHKLTLI